jgi:hypothetical protein
MQVARIAQASQRQEEITMTYVKPHIEVLGDAARLIHGSLKMGPLLENNSAEPIPDMAYEVDD